MGGYYVGLDLGEVADYTAIAVIQYESNGSFAAGKPRGPGLHLRHLERFPLRTGYDKQADRVAELMRSPKLQAQVSYEWEHNANRPWEQPIYYQEPQLVVDHTGVGRGVVHLLRERGLRYKAITITGGDVAKHTQGSSVPKRDLVAALVVPFQTGRLKIARGLELWPTLKNELLNFRRKVSIKTAHDSYEHWREGDHDDLVLAAAMACWYAERRRDLPAAVPKPKGW